MFELTDTPLDVAALTRRLDHPGAGALASFEGRVRNRNHDRTVVRLRYEAYDELARRTGEAVLKEAHARFEITDVVAVHRVGMLDIGEIAAWVGVCSAHRGAAFDACRYVMEQLKTRLPIWKREEYAEGEPRWL
jgi:molybdopterin synthase catalytic subunit